MAVKNLRQQTIFDGYGDINAGIMGGGYQPVSQFPSYGSDDEDPYSASQPPSTDTSYVGSDIKGVASRVNRAEPSIYDYPTSAQRMKEMAEGINSIYTPSTHSDDRNNALLDNVPDINDYNPSFARKLVAGLQSIKDPTQGQKTLNQPYLQDMGQWTAKTAPFQAAASSENARNVNERTLAGNIVNSVTTQDRAERQAETAAERNRITEENNQMRNEQATTRNRIAALKANGWEIQKAGSRFIAFNPITHETVDAGSSNGMDRADELALIGKNQLAAAAAMGSGVVQGPDGKLYRPNPDPNAPNNYVPQTGIPPGQVNKLGTEPKTNTLEDIRARNERMKQYYDTDPDAKKFFKMGTTGSPEMKPRPVVGSHGVWPFNNVVTEQDVKDYDAVRKSFFPDYVPPTGLAPANAPPNPNQQAAPSVKEAATQGLGPRSVPALPAAGQPAQPVNARPPAANQGPISQQPQVPANKPAMQTEVNQLTRQLNDPTVPDESKQAIFDRIQFLNKQIESTPSQTPWLWDQAKNAGNAVMSGSQPSTPSENIYQKQVMTPNGPVTVPPGKVAIRNLETGEIVQIPAENLQKAIQTGKFVGVK